MYLGSCASGSALATQATIPVDQQIATLDVGKLIERTLATGESHSYQIHLTSGQLLHFIVEQRGIDVIVRVVGPNEQNLLEVDNTSDVPGDESVTLIADMPGTYRVNITSASATAPSGRYAIHVTDLRSATTTDRVLQEANDLNRDVERLHDGGQYDAALPLAERSLAIRERELGATHPDVATSLDNLAWLNEAKADYAKAEGLYIRALTIREKALGELHSATADSLNNLALLYDAQGEYAKEEPLLIRALAIYEKVRGKEHPDTALSLNNLAMLYRATGDYGKAEPLLVRALSVFAKTIGDQPDTAIALNNLGMLYYLRGEYAKAEPLYSRALSIRQRVLGSEHPLTAGTLNNLAYLYNAKGDYIRAEALFQRALAIKTSVFGPDHPDVGLALHNLGMVAEGQREYGRAESLYQRALAIWQRALGSDHPNVAHALNNLALFYRTIGNVERAIIYQERGNDARERTLNRNLIIGSERQKLLYLSLSATEIDQTLSLHLQAAPRSRQARLIALTILLRRKGRALDAMSDVLGQLRHRASAPDQALLNNLIALRSQLATATLRGPGNRNIDEHRAYLKQLDEHANQLEGELSSRSAVFRAQSAPITMESVQKAIPPSAVLVEFAAYRPYNAIAHQYGTARYVAYTLSTHGDPLWVDLGDAASIEHEVDALRAALRDATRVDVKRLARALDAKVMEPIRRLTGHVNWFLISPDGALNLVPFGALIDPRGHYLLQHYRFTYLTSGRDLLRFQTVIAPRETPLVLANPDFGGGKSADELSRSAMSIEAGSEQASTHLLSNLFFSPLPGTAAEGEALRQIMPDATVLMGRTATKTALLQLDGPKILHIATHGFFLENVAPSQIDARSTQFRSEDPARLFVIKNTGGTDVLHIENPRLRSGLALAGANEHKLVDDGIMTALEVAGLSLWGTRLVVLSACDTGVGEIKNGEGVYGLRRALVLAGAESQVMSLWPVSDAATRDLMIAYYRALMAGRGRGEALRHAQLAMMHDSKRNHPAFWASFIQSGQWTSIAESN